MALGVKALVGGAVGKLRAHTLTHTLGVFSSALFRWPLAFSLTDVLKEHYMLLY